MRVWTILVLTTFLGACQQAGQPPVTKQTGAGVDAGYFEAEVETLMTQISDRLVESCRSSAQLPDKLNRCLRDQFALAFDDSGLGRRNCDFHASLADYLSCVAIGNTLIDLRHRLSDDSPVPSGFWSGETAMSDALINSIVKRGKDACGTAGLSQMKDCLVSWFEQRLELPAAMLDRCKTRAPEDRQEECWGEAYMLRYLQDHVPRLGAINT